MVKKILITLGIIMVVMVVGLGVLLAKATESQPPRNISVYHDGTIVDKCFPNIQGFFATDYEFVRWDEKDKHDKSKRPMYRGYIFLTEEEAQRLLEDYDWEIADDIEPEFFLMEDYGSEDTVWYRSDEFTSEVTLDALDEIEYVRFWRQNYVVFDGHTIAFEFYRIAKY